MVDSLFVMTGWFFYRQSESVLPLLAGAPVHALTRFNVFRRSIGKFLFGLVVINLETGHLCGRAGSAKRMSFSYLLAQISQQLSWKRDRWG